MKFSVIKNREFMNAGWIIGEQIFQMGVSLIIGILSARYLGPSNFGALNYTASFVNFCISIATLSMEGVVIKKMIEEPDREGDFLGSCLVYRLIASILSMGAIILVVYYLNPNEPLKVLLLFLQSFQLVFRALQLFDSWFQRYLKAKYISIGKMIACVMVSAYKVFLLASGKGIIWFAISNVLTDLIISIVLFFFYRKEKGQKLVFHLSTGNEVLKDSYHFIVAGLMTAVYSQMDRIMIGSMMTDEAVGLYTTATAISGMWIFVPTAIINSFRPKIIELKNNKNEIAYSLRLKQLYSGIIWLCICASIMISLLARWIVLVLYGEPYSGAVYTLKIAIWFETFSMIGVARGIWILSENKNKYVKYYLGIGAVTNMVLNVILIPKYGINGAAVATLVTQIVTSLIAPMLFRETRQHTKIVFEAFVFKWLWGNSNNISS